MSENETDPFAGTIYRDLVSAEDAVVLARFNAGAEPPTTAAAAITVIDNIDEAIRALHKARAKLTAIAVDYNQMLDEKYVLSRQARS